jgi:hypothetical protein
MQSWVGKAHIPACVLLALFACLPQAQPTDEIIRIYRCSRDVRPSGVQSSCSASFCFAGAGTGSYAVPARSLPPTGFPRKNGRALARSATAGSKIPPTTLVAITGRIGEIRTSPGEKTDAITTIFNSGFVSDEPRAARIVASGKSAAAVRRRLSP